MLNPEPLVLAGAPVSALDDADSLARVPADPFEQPASAEVATALFPAIGGAHSRAAEIQHNPARTAHSAKFISNPSPASLEKPAPVQSGLLGRMEFSANIALVSDYLVSGVSFTNGAAAIQGGFDVEESSGWSAGVWASNIAESDGANFELDVYGAKTFQLGETELSLGAMAILFPGASDLGLGMAQASLARAIGPIDATLAVNYAWPQAILGDKAGSAVELEVATPVGALLGIPLTLDAGIGYSDGSFSLEGTTYDWSLSMTATFAGTDFAVSYVDTDISGELGEPAWVFSIAHTV